MEFAATVVILTCTYALLAAGILVFRIALPANQPLVLVASALTGLALGATVAPALFVAGFSLQSNSLQRVFAIIELFRAVAAFMVAPIFVHFAATVGHNPNEGTGIALWIGFGLAVIVGSTLGIGILRTPGLVAGQLPSRTAILAVWVVGGLYTLVGAACLAELGRFAQHTVVVCIRTIALQRLAGGKELSRKLQPGICEPRIELDGTPQHPHRLGTAAIGRVRATELELHKR